MFRLCNNGNTGTSQRNCTMLTVVTEHETMFEDAKWRHLTAAALEGFCELLCDPQIMQFNDFR